MDVANELVDFAPDRSQLARVQTAGMVSGPPAWVAIAAVAAALGLSLSLALPPATSVTHGAVSVGRSNAPIDKPSDAKR